MDTTVKLSAKPRWDRSKHLQSVVATGAAALAATLAAAQDKPRNPENSSHRQTVHLPDGRTFDLHLHGYESRVAVCGNWPKDGNDQRVTPRDAIPATPLRLPKSTCVVARSRLRLARVPLTL